jgi:hypothetical protein
MGCIIVETTLHVRCQTSSRYTPKLIWTFVMSTTTPQSLLVSALASDDVKDPKIEALSDSQDVTTDTWVERDCLCGTFSAPDRPLAMPVNAIKSRW